MTASKLSHPLIIAHLFWNHRRRRTTGDDSQQIVPSSNDVTSMSLDEILEWNRHFFFNCARVVYMSRNVEQFCSRIPRSSKTGKPFSSTSANIRGNSYCFNIGNCGGATKNSDISGKWGL